MLISKNEIVSKIEKILKSLEINFIPSNRFPVGKKIILYNILYT